MSALKAEAEIFVDRWGVAHVYARTLHDLFFLFGYVQAWDRLWQMEYTRRVASGRLAEILGPDLLPVDRFTRRVGFKRVSEKSVQALTGEGALIIGSFVEGINMYIGEASRRPVEFELLGYEPEPWEASDVSAASMLAAFNVTPNWDLEVIRSLLLASVVSPEDLAALEMEGFEAGAGGTRFKAAAAALGEFRRAIPQALGPLGGSNAWAIAGSRTTSGKPVLAGDPHLAAGIPNIWHQVHLSCGDLDVIGAAMPGIPGVIIGHNRHAAWSVTAGMVDCSDIFIDDGDGQTVPEEIKVAGAETVVEEVFVGRHGPDIGPAVGVSDRRLCLKTVFAGGDSLVGPLLNIARSKDWSGFREALSEWTAPVLTFVYADRHGDIGSQLAGQVPIRAGGAKGLLPNEPGDGEWTGFIPFAELPSLHNPDEGFVVSTNNRQAPADYPYWLGIDFIEGARAPRIVEMLRAREKHSPLDVSRMQVDVESVPARQIVAALCGLALSSPACRPALDLLASWDCRLAADSAAACVYTGFVREMSRRIGKRRLGGGGDFWMGRYVNPLTGENGWVFNQAAKLAQLLSEQPSGWFDSWADQAEGALRDAVELLGANLGADISKWRYGRLHRLTLRHPLGDGDKDALLNRGPYEAPGDAQCVFANGMPADGFDVVLVPGFRQVVDLSDVNAGHAMMPGGQSGDPASTHYDDLTPFWLEGRMHRQYFARTDVVRHSESSLRLLPAAD